MGISLGDGAGLVGNGLKSIPLIGPTTPEFVIGAVLENVGSDMLRTAFWQGVGKYFEMPANARQQPKSDAFSPDPARDPVMIVLKLSPSTTKVVFQSKVIANTSDISDDFGQLVNYLQPLPASAKYLSFSLKTGTSIAAIRLGTTFASVTTVSNQFDLF